MKSTSRRCKTCRKKVPAESAFVSQLRFFCSFECLSQFTKSECGAKAVAKTRKAETRERKQKLKTKSDHMKDAVRAFNAYIRWRDRDDPCISCGNFILQDMPGGGWDAGHYRSTGSAPHLRFMQNQVHKQCVKCNRFLSGNVAEYRKGLIRKIGIEKVMEIESDNQERRFDIEYLQRIKTIFTKKKKIKQKVLQKRS